MKVDNKPPKRSDRTVVPLECRHPGKNSRAKHPELSSGVPASCRSAVNRLNKLLREKEAIIKKQAGELMDANTALNVLLSKRERDQAEIEKNVLANIRDLVAPMMQQLRTSGLDKRQQGYLSVLENNLKHIVSPLSLRLATAFDLLTPAELKVVNLVEQGKTSKEIAGMLNLSDKTIETHRRNIRRKLNLNNGMTNLRTYLLSLSQSGMTVRDNLLPAPAAFSRH
jgi:DNA-binding NarL/FixJ family response regulator